MSLDFVILAAGNSSRMHSTTPKFFHTIAGKPVIRCIVDTVRESNPQNVIIVTREELKHSEYFSDTTVKIQPEPLGTADAVKYALDALSSEYTIILCGDMPMISAEQLKNLADTSSDNALIAMTLPPEFRHMPYGRIVINNGKFEKIVEYKNATDAEKSIILANTGVYKIKTDLLKKYIPQIEKNAVSGEYYLTDIFEFIRNVEVIQFSDYEAFHGINTMQDLAKAEAIMQNRLRQKFMANGVKLIAPETVHFSYDTEIERDVLIEPNVIIGTNVKIGSKSRIFAFSHIQDCVIANNVEIGPFARIRGNSSFADGTAIGNFVEVKGSTFGSKTKAKHLAYIGDTTIGYHANIGAGTITCNYDGVKKHKTTIGNNVFVGSNSTLIAPITIEDNTILGAGSTFTDAVPAGALAIARQKQTNLPQKANDIWKKKGKK
ncbi:MAG: bifunctional UDP-N-acetylglucosamine diphosphorylase/glucosamine-1-phosphate N-acetyltransferase GlmU [Alphaproteobacteria bacterium]|nr:bifunctional UDP-N-acetylglucosamine diphosphorylase/glucosamine-1-phosphate N-acetyltransferase GlmU [Alphaproteobacteria bacterium]